MRRRDGPRAPQPATRVRQAPTSPLLAGPGVLTGQLWTRRKDSACAAADNGDMQIDRRTWPPVPQWRISRRALLTVLLAVACAGAAAQPVSAWLDAQGRPGPRVSQALDLLSESPSHGLRSADYELLQLRKAAAALAEPVGSEGGARAQSQGLADRLDAAMLRYLNDLHRGRVDPRQLQLRFTPMRRGPFDAAALLAETLASGRLDEAVRRAVPPLPQYQQLRQALAHYRGLAAHPAWLQALPPLPASVTGRGRSLSVDQAWAGLPGLADRLMALGDLANDGPVPSRAEAPLVDAMRSFQRRHGLAEDGVLGPITLAALNVTPAARAQQIELALERLRWTPLLQGPRMVLINIPEFMLRAYEVVDGRIELRQQMKVIVGKALDTQTPLFDEDMRFIEFSPYWNVPRSIARGEIVPKLRRDPAYFDREGFEFVTADGQVLSALTPQRISDLQAGALRIRQRPGPKNALGDIKFIFPNQQSIFLHHTPSVGLFERERRDFSHGCIRVEQPVALARFVLQGQAAALDWSDERIHEAMAAGRSRTLRLDQPLPVLIAYGTSLVKDGRIHFFDDLYGQDRLLYEALRRARPALIAKD